jgi:exodeoxyribonuclease VII large subunit
LQLAFEQLRRRLEAEGLFDEARKRPLPEHPQRVGIVTSPAGAAIRDVIQLSGRRSPGTPLLIAPTRVQGDGAELEIAAALRDVVCEQDVDVVLLVRGGGSLEDLWCFNTEPVVRAIAACPVPVVSGVGHETDFTLADFVADQRAATPSAAALLALPDRSVLRDRLAAGWVRLSRAVQARLADRLERLERARGALRVLAPTARLRAQQGRLRAALRALLRAAETTSRARRTRYQRTAERLSAERPRTQAARLRLRGVAAALARAAAHATAGPRARLARLAAQLDSLSPLAVLGRGYAVARRADDGRIVRGAGDIAPGERLAVRVARARIAAVVEAVEEADD